MLHNFFIRRPCRLGNNVEKYCIAGQARDDRQRGVSDLRAE
jgi:hypothetical protein